MLLCEKECVSLVRIFEFLSLLGRVEEVEAVNDITRKIEKDEVEIQQKSRERRGRRKKAR